MEKKEEETKEQFTKKIKQVLSKDDIDEEFKIFDSNNKINSNANVLKDNKTGYLLKLKSLKDNNYYAVKICNQLSEDMVKEALQNVQIVMSIDHPNLIKYYDVYYWDEEQDNGKVYIVAIKMEFSGTNLESDIIKQSAKNHKFTDVEILYMLKYCLDALTFLQKNKINHLAIKPSNILINDLGVIKYSDFGFSKPRQNGDNLTSLSFQDQPNNYSSPEYQTTRENEDLQESFDAEKSDLFSLGLSLVRMANLEKEEKIVGINTLESSQQSKITDLVKKIQSKYLQAVFNNMLSIDVQKRCNIADLHKIMKKGRLEIVKQQVNQSEDD